MMINIILDPPTLTKSYIQVYTKTVYIYTQIIIKKTGLVRL